MSQYNFIWALVYITLLEISIGMLVYLIICAKKSALLYSFFFFHAMTILWNLYSLIKVTAASYISGMELYIKVFNTLSDYYGTFFGGFTGLAWLILSLSFVGWKHSKNIRALFLLASPLILLFSLLCTKRFYPLFFTEAREFGPLYWLYSFISYTYSAIGLIVLVSYALKQEKYEKRRSLILAVSYVLPLLYLLYTNFAYLLRLPAFSQHYISPAPVAFSFATALIIFIIAKYRFLNIAPMAINKIVDNLDRAVLIIDASSKVMNVNRYFTDLFAGGRQVRHNDNIAFLNDHIARHMEKTPDNDAVLAAINSSSDDFFKGELSMNLPERKYFEVVVQPVKEDIGVLGRIIVFDDITLIKNAMEELKEKNEALSDLNAQLLDKNRQLREYASTAEELAVMKERQRFSHDAHDILGHTMTVLITQLKVADILCDKDTGEVRSRIRDCIAVAKDGLNELRKSIMGLIPGKLSDSNIEAAVTQLIHDFKNTGMKIDVTTNGSASALPMEYMQPIFRLCQEALTNSLRHGKASHADIVFNFTDIRVKILITDDGAGCKEIKKGYGLTGMEERITGLGGTIHYGSDGESGFNIFVELPYAAVRQREGQKIGILASDREQGDLI